MHVTYDPEVDILMIDLVDGESRAKRFARNFRVPDGGPILDLAEDGTVLGVEIMGAARRYGAAALVGLPLKAGEPLPLAEAAARVGLTPHALKLAAQRGRLGARKIGRNWTTTAAELDAYQASRKHAGPGSAMTAGRAGEAGGKPAGHGGRPIADEATATAKASAPRARKPKG